MARMRGLVPLLLLDALLGIACAGAAEQPIAPAVAPEHLFAIPTTRDGVGRVLAPVMINGQGPFRFIVDTGADHSTISPSLAAALLLVPSSRVLLHGVTGSAEVDAVHVSDMRAGKLKLYDQLLPLIGTPMMAGADGMLGVAGWTDQRISVDFRHDHIAIEKSNGFTSRWQNDLRMRAMKITGGLLAIDGHVGRVRVKAVIDTGAERTIGNIALRNALRARHSATEPLPVTPVYGATPEVGTAESEAGPSIDLGESKITGVQLFFSDLHVFGVWNLQKEPAILIGMDVLGTLDSLVIDYWLQEVHFGV